jgi:hypothetical protein
MTDEATDHVEEHLRSVFPEGSITRVDVLRYGDDPSVEPGETAVRVVLDRAGRPEGKEGDEETVRSFEEGNRAAIRQLRHELPSTVAWVEFRPDRPAGAGRPRGPILRIKVGGRGGRADSMDDVAEELTPVMTRLGTADLATVDTLITAGIANSRAEVIRWALGRIRENPAYGELQARVQEIDELKAHF